MLSSDSAAIEAHVMLSVDGAFQASPICNTYGGSYSASMEGRIAVEVGAGSRVGCSGDGNAVEDAFLDAVEAVETYEVDGDRLTLRGPASRLSFRLASE